MFWQKPSNLKFTDLCIFFDENFNSENRDDEKCYKYMYCIYYMLACKKKYFQRYEEYDDFAIYATGVIYMRFLKKLQKGEKIRSLLNYAKASLYPLKVNFQKNEYRDYTNPEDEKALIANERIIDSMKNNYRYNRREINQYLAEEIQSIPYLIKEEVMNSPYKKDPVKSRKLYVSVLISVIRGVTLSNENKRKLEKRIATNKELSDTLLAKMYMSEREMSTALWKLDSSMFDYVTILTRKVLRQLHEDIQEIINSCKVDETIVNDIMKSSWENSSHNKYTDGEIEE